MLSDLYNDKILAYAANIPRLGRLEAPDASTRRTRSRLCGSQVTVDVRMEDGRVADFAHDVKACALGQASSAIMAANVIGLTENELAELERQMTAMLKEGGPPPTGKFADFACLAPVAAHKSRHASTLLTFGATLEAVRKASLAKAA
ncbi:MAG: iron-sulfur cluster assembly scaffold protein [Acuticoccus sp.]